MTNQLRVISYNIHKGFTTGNLRFVLKRIRDALRVTDADLVFLQEVVGAHEGHRQRVPAWPEEAQFEFLADSVWPHFAYGRNAVYDAGHHGNAILSKFPIRSSENIDISMNRFEQRGILHAVIEVPGQPQNVHALCTHLNLTARSRERQIDELVLRVDGAVPRGDSLVIGGDFNDWSTRASNRLSRSLSMVEVFHSLHGTHARTFPSQFPLLQLDRIYCRGLRPIEAKALQDELWQGLSDHIPLWAEVGF